MNYPELERCIAVVQALRHPKTGCPWDLEQSHQSLLKYLIEESYEFIEATETGDPKLMEEELGDVLLQVLLHSTIASENNHFDLESVARTLADKIVRRHPHVFAPSKDNISTAEVIENWKEIKIQEKGAKKYSIDQKLLHAPSLESSFRIGQKSTKVNFDWGHYREVMDKVEEEWQELKDELPLEGTPDPKKVQEELGDLLFSVAQLGRHLGINPEEALREANQKFISRFQKVEDHVRLTGKKLEECSQQELENFWIKVKQS